MSICPRSPMRVAVVGSGAAAAGVLRAISEWAPTAEVTIFDDGEPVVGQFETELAPQQRSAAHYRDLYSHLRREHGLKFPPPKTHFGYSPAHYAVEGWGRIWRSQGIGGLTNFWGGSALPFTDRELRSWPFGRAELDPYYARIAAMVGISGRQDALNGYLGEDFANRPPLHMPVAIDALDRALGESGDDGAYRLFAGASRLALETREGHRSGCQYWGDCMSGCSAGAIYNARSDIARFRAEGMIVETVKARVLAVTDKRRVRVAAGDGESAVGPFDRVYVAAGCIGSTEIAMRSLGMTEGPVMADNAIYSFPIVYIGGAVPDPAPDRYFALTNLVIACVPEDAHAPTAVVQIYPTFDHLWRYYVPPGLWPAFQGLGRALRRRLMLGRLYLHSDQSQSYALRLESDDSLRLRLDRQPARLRDLPGLWQSIRRGIGKNGFHVPDLPPIRHKTSSHYAASLPLGEGPVGATGEIMPGVYLCDSATFTDGPALSPTFTIMAAACRTVHRSLGGAEVAPDRGDSFFDFGAPVAGIGG